MKVFVYGTLKNGYGNNRLLSNSTFVSNHIVAGYKLYNVGFPVAIPDENSSVEGEVWDIGDSTSTLASLDRLEGEGYMYDRVQVDSDLHMYVGNTTFWKDQYMRECPNQDNVYRWERDRW